MSNSRQSSAPQKSIEKPSRGVTAVALLEADRLHAGYPRIGDMVTLLQANSHVYVALERTAERRGPVYQRLVEAGFEDRVRFGMDQRQWPKLMAYSIGDPTERD